MKISGRWFGPVRTERSKKRIFDRDFKTRSVRIRDKELKWLGTRPAIVTELENQAADSDFKGIGVTRGPTYTRSTGGNPASIQCTCAFSEHDGRPNAIRCCPSAVHVATPSTM